jgi:hypothetical protein
MQQEVEAASEGGRAMKTKWSGQIAVILARDKNGNKIGFTVVFGIYYLKFICDLEFVYCNLI